MYNFQINVRFGRVDKPDPGAAALIYAISEGAFTFNK